MPVSPMDFELYSRVTGSPMPMSAAERMKMAPEVYQFTKDYTKSQNRQAMGRNILKIGALGALGAAAYYGSRNFGTPSQELGQELTETSTAANLVENAAEKAAQSVGSNTVSQSLATDQTPRLTEENAAVTAEEPSQLNINTSMKEAVRKPTPNIDAAIERKNVRRPTPSVARGKYQQYETTTNPEERQERNLAAMVGGGEIFLGQSAGAGEVVKTKEAQLYDDKGEKELLGKYVGMMKGEVDPTLEEVSGQTTENYGPELLVDDSFGSPLTDHPDVKGGEDDIDLPGGMNTSSTTNLSPKVLGIALSLPKDLGASTEEKLIIANEIDKKRQLNPLEQRAVDNEAAMGSMRLSDEERKKESIRLGSTGGIPNKTDMAEIRKDPEYIAAQESMSSKKPVVIKLKDPSQIKVRVTDVGAGGKEYVRKDEMSEKNAPQTTTEKVDNFTANFVEGAKSDIIRGQRGNQSLGLTTIPATNGDAQTGFVLANRPLDQSPDTATVYNFGVDAAGEDYLKDYPITEQNYDTMMDRGMGESRRRKRQAGQIFSYLAEADRNVTGKAQLGGFGNIDPNFRLASRRD